MKQTSSRSLSQTAGLLGGFSLLGLIICANAADLLSYNTLLP
jgi:hypothetical protein